MLLTGPCARKLSEVSINGKRTLNFKSISPADVYGSESGFSKIEYRNCYLLRSNEKKEDLKGCKTQTVDGLTHVRECYCDENGCNGAFLKQFSPVLIVLSLVVAFVAGLGY